MQELLSGGEGEDKISAELGIVFSPHTRLSVEEKYNLLEDYIATQSPEDVIQVRVQQLGIAKVLRPPEIAV